MGTISVNRLLRTIVIFLAVIAAAALILVYGFRISSVTVVGNDRYSAQQISSDLTGSNLLKNTLYFAWKYRSAVPSEDAPYLQSVKATILSPTSVRVKVSESRLIGRVQADNQNVYFDEDGIVQMITGDVYEGIPLVTGVDIDTPVLYQKLSLDNASTLRTMLSITQLLIQSDFIPDSVAFDASGNMTLRFGTVVVKLGQDEYLEEKIANLVQIYPQIEGHSGTLNMEGFTGKNSSITFKEDGAAAEGETETEADNTSGETLTGVGTDSQEMEEAPASGSGSAEGGDTAAEASSSADGSDGAGADDSASGQDAQAGADNTGEDKTDEEQKDEAEESVGSGVMAFDSDGNLHYDARIVNGQVVDASGNPIPGCSVDENGNIKDGYWNVIDPKTGSLLS